VIRRGDIRWYRFSPPDKRRPVLVLTRDSALDYLSEITVASITSKVRDVPTEVLLTEADGMPRMSAINLDHVHTVSRERLGGLIATLPPERMGEVGSALSFALGFSSDVPSQP